MDFIAGTGTVIIGGESAQPETVLKELSAEIARVGTEGFDAERFERAKRASYGARLRGLEDFDNVCVSLAEGVFGGYCALDAPLLLGEIGKGACEAFVRECLQPERLSIAILDPKKG